MLERCEGEEGGDSFGGVPDGFIREDDVQASDLVECFVVIEPGQESGDVFGGVEDEVVCIADYGERGRGEPGTGF